MSKNHPSNSPIVEALDSLFTYHPPSAEDVEKYTILRTSAQRFAEKVLLNCPPCADRSAAIRSIRDALMTANAAIALDIDGDE